MPSSLRRTAARLRYDSAYRLLAPFYRINYPAYRNAAEQFLALKDARVGERCVIMGNGPSLNNTDLSRLNREVVWASNRAYLLFDRIDWRPVFWVAVDRRVVPDIASELSVLHRELPSTLFFYPDYFLLAGHLKPAPNTTWFREISNKHPSPHSRFSRAPHIHIASVATVTITALQIAVWMGFNPIYLIGCDTSYRVPGSVRKDNVGGLTSTADDDPNHFDPTYFGEGRRWHEPRVDRMIAHYEVVLEATRDMGVEVLNATVGGELEVFPRVDYEKEF